MVENREISIITNISGNSPTWTNKAITLNVTAQGKNGSQIVGYSFDNGVTWQSTNTMTYSGNQNKTVMIKVKDEQGNISAGTNQNIKIDMDKPTVGKIVVSVS